MPISGGVCTTAYSKQDASQLLGHDQTATTPKSKVSPSLSKKVAKDAFSVVELVDEAVAELADAAAVPDFK